MVSWGCSGGAQRSCWDHLHIIQLGSRKTHVLKNWPFSLYACGNGVDLPMWPSTPLATEWASICKSHAVWQSPSSRTEKLRTFSKSNFFDLLLRAHSGDFCGLRAVGHISWLAMLVGWHASWRFQPAAGRLNTARV